MHETSASKDTASLRDPDTRSSHKDPGPSNVAFHAEASEMTAGIKPSSQV